ncbi:hypothetical protein AGMMS49991_01620 [Spirochaetia bacterium]|nr:hypothetical protein AGMMS49991_01620 [Spirochaetia bacterium]
MPWRFIGFVVICGVFLIFIGLNLGNTCDISFGFASIKNVPVFFTAFASFVLGLICSIPIAIGIRLKRSKAGSENLEAPSSALKPKKNWGKKGKADSADSLTAQKEDEGGPYGDDGSYGID